MARPDQIAGSSSTIYDSSKPPFRYSSPVALTTRITPATVCLLAIAQVPILLAAQSDRPRARDLGLSPGVFPPGQGNAITDVAGVLVGQVTLIEGDNIRTGVTAILPHAGNIFQNKVPGAVSIGNAFGKLAGFTQVQELGTIETPIVLTNTLNVGTAMEGVIAYTLAQPGNEDVRSVNALVGETNDGGLNDIRGMHVSRDNVLAAIRNAKSGPVAEGSVGAGTGTICFGWKGGIGTSSRLAPKRYGAYTVGVLVQTNFGGVLTIGGAPVGRELGKYPFAQAARPSTGDGSCMIVVATDAPLTANELRRLAARAVFALARTGSSYSNGSGEYAIAFSTAASVRVKAGANQPSPTPRCRVKPCRPCSRWLSKLPKKLFTTPYCRQPQFIRRSALRKQFRSIACARYWLSTISAASEIRRVITYKMATLTRKQKASAANQPIKVGLLKQSELQEADRIVRLAFGTFLGLPNPLEFMGDRNFLVPRWRSTHVKVIAAREGGRLIGSNVATRWGSFGLFGPLTVLPEYWDRGVAQRLLEATMTIFDRWGVRRTGLFTFPHSAKHVGLYQKFGYWPGYLTAIMTRTPEPDQTPRTKRPEASALLSSFNKSRRAQAIQACAKLTGKIDKGLDLGEEIRATLAQRTGDVVLTYRRGILDGFAVCLNGSGSEGGEKICYVKFGAARAGAGAAERFDKLLEACEAFASSRKAIVEAGVNLAREDAYRRMRSRGYRVIAQGVAMQRPHAVGFNRPDAYVIDDWR